MFLCRLNPSCPFSCSTVDPPWHFSAGAHEASCHWQTGTLQLKYPEETRDQRWLFPSSLLFVLVSTSLFFSIRHLSRSLGVLLFSQLRTFCTYCTHTVIDRELESQQSYSQLLFPLELLLNGASSLTVNWQCTTGNIIRVWLWSWFPLDIQTSPVMKSSSQFVIFVSAVMVTVWGQVVHHWSLINSITGSATGLTNLFCHNKAD